MLTSGIEKAATQLRKGLLSASEVCRLCLEQSDQIKCLNAFITTLKDEAIQEADRSEERHSQKKPLSPLDGIPIAVKDNFCTRGVRTTCGSNMLADFVPPYTATVVERLVQAGAVLVGKTNLDEFAMGSGTVDSIFGPTRNIWNSNLPYSVDKKVNDKPHSWRIAGGSSGGSAVAVATGACFAALGSDTGGSTRNPASYCGVVGLKPTYSSVSRHGLIPLVNSMDVPGILTRNVDDAALIYNSISGHDPRDSTTVKQVPKVRLSPTFNCSKIRVGIPKEYYCNELSSNVRQTCEFVIDMLQKGGAQIIQISMPYTEYSISCYSVLNQCEVASNMARYDGLRYGHRVYETFSTDKLYASTRLEGLNQVVRERILAGNYFLLRRNYQKYFEKALKVRRLIHQDFQKAWSQVDVLLTATTLSEAPLLEEYTQLDNREQCSIHDFCTQPANMTGCPAISLPIRVSANGLPLSVQIMAKNYGEQVLLSVAKWIEERAQFPVLELEKQLN